MPLETFIFICSKLLSIQYIVLRQAEVRKGRVEDKREEGREEGMRKEGKGGSRRKEEREDRRDRGKRR